MAVFEFDGPNISVSDITSVNVGFIENGIGFTLSTTGNPGANNLAYGDLGGGEHFLEFSDNGAVGDWTLALDSFIADSGPAYLGGADGHVVFDIHNLGNNWDITFLNTGGSSGDLKFAGGINGTGLRSFTLEAGEFYSGIRFTPSSGSASSLSIDSLTANIVCYLAGTGIATPQGRRLVEDLRPGDQILTADGGTTTLRWLGEQPVHTPTTNRAKTYPICIRAGALAPQVPQRDLFVSPNHAMEVDGMLINAAALINGSSIYQVGRMPQEGFTYYHIDTGRHELVLAEGAASETYLDLVGREVFVNGHEMKDAPPIAEMDVPRISAARLVPQAIKIRLGSFAARINAA